MTVLKTSKIKTALGNKGFIKGKTKKHHKYRYYKSNKKTAIFTIISLGAKEIDDSLIAIMAKQLKIKRKEFINLIKCTLSKEKYYELIKDLINNK